MASNVVRTVVGIVEAMDRSERSELLEELAKLMGREVESRLGSGRHGKASGSKAPAWARLVTGFDWSAKGMDMFPGEWTKLAYRDRADGGLGLTFRTPPTDGEKLLFGFRKDGVKLYALAERDTGATFSLAVSGREFKVLGASLLAYAETVGELADEVEDKGLMAASAVAR